METITAGRRRTLPPVPRPAPDRDTRPSVLRRPPVPATAPPARPAPAAGAAPAVPVPVLPADAPGEDPAQAFVSTLRAAASRFATAAGAATAVVAEAVPPARHRRARCRVLLLDGDGAQSAVTFVGAAGRPTAGSAVRFTGAVTGWLAGAARGGALDQAEVVDLPG
jgi:hypothetical protein